jgi:ADP-ribosylglycohydrolase
VVADTVDEALDAASVVLESGGPLELAVRRGTELGRTAASDDAALDALHADFGHLHWVHVVNNAATIAFALSRGRGDFGHSISLAVTAGWDTDSVGATVGGVVGAVVGARALPERWVQPLDNRLATSLPGPAELAIDGLATATADLAVHGSRGAQ